MTITKKRKIKLLNILVSSQLLRHSIQCENIFNTRAFGILILALVVSALTGIILASVGNIAFIPVTMVMPIVIIIYGLVFPLNGIGDPRVEPHTNIVYQKEMLSNNRKIKHDRKCNKHYHKLLLRTNNKRKIADYGYKTHTAKNNMYKLEHYNASHKNKAYIPKLEKDL